MLLIWSSSTIITSWQTLCLPQCSCNSSSRCTCTQALTPIPVAACKQKKNLPSRCCRQPKVLTVFISAAGGWFAATWSRILLHRLKLLVSELIAHLPLWLDQAWVWIFLREEGILPSQRTQLKQHSFELSDASPLSIFTSNCWWSHRYRPSALVIAECWTYMLRNLIIF